jgi:HlyD family secretion protein
MMRKILFVILLLLGIAALAGALYRILSPGEALPVSTTEVRLSSLRGNVSTNGKIEARKVFELHAPFAGACRRILARAGDVLKAGQPVLEIEVPSLASDIVAAHSELEAARRDLQNVRRGPAPEEFNQAGAEVERLRLEVANLKKTQQQNEWLLERDAVPRSEVEQGRQQLAIVEQQLNAALTRRADLQSRYTEADRRSAEARLEAARTKAEFLESQRAQSVVRAPADGTLFHFELKPGAFVSAGETLGLFGDLSRLNARAFVDEPELGHVAAGAEVTIQWDALPKERWKGVVSLVPPEVVSRGTRSVAEVLCAVTDPPNGLIPNINVDVEISTGGGAGVPALPRTAVFLDGKDHFVWTIREGRAVRRNIETGRGTSALIEVTGDLSVGDRVIIPGEAPVAEGMKVRVVER